MSQFLTSDYLIAFLFSVIRMSTPIIFCALGALIASHAGAINMALEGIMLTASLLAVMFSGWLQNCWAGLLGGVLGRRSMFLPLFLLHLCKDCHLILTRLGLNNLAFRGQAGLGPARRGTNNALAVPARDGRENTRGGVPPAVIVAPSGVSS